MLITYPILYQLISKTNECIFNVPNSLFTHGQSDIIPTDLILCLKLMPHIINIVECALVLRFLVSAYCLRTNLKSDAFIQLLIF